MVERNVHKLLRTWFGSLLNVLKRERSACAAVSLKEGASSGRNPPRLSRRMKLSRRLRSRSLEYPHQAGEPYINRPIVVAAVNNNNNNDNLYGAVTRPYRYKGTCYQVKGFLRHPSRSESSQGV